MFLCEIHVLLVLFFEHSDFVCAADAWFVLCTNKIYTYVLKKYCIFSITKSSVNALMKLAGFSTSNKFKNHCFMTSIPCSTKTFRRFFSNNISFPERRNKRKSVLEITKMYYFKI